MKRYVFLFSFIFSCFHLIGQAADPEDIIGIWKSPSEGLMIKIDKVGNHFQGRIIWLNNSKANQPALDANNPDERLQKMPLKGNKVIKELSYNSSEFVWDGGTFYHYEEGKLYNCHIAVHSDNQINIARYIQNPQDAIVETWVRQ